MEASERHGFEGEGFSYLRSPMWWGGIITRTFVVATLKDHGSVADQWASE